MLKVLRPSTRRQCPDDQDVAPTLDDVARRGRGRGGCWRGRWRKRLRTTSRRTPMRAMAKSGDLSCATPHPPSDDPAQHPLVEHDGVGKGDRGASGGLQRAARVVHLDQDSLAGGHRSEIRIAELGASACKKPQGKERPGLSAPSTESSERAALTGAVDAAGGVAGRRRGHADPWMPLAQLDEEDGVLAELQKAR